MKILHLADLHFGPRHWSVVKEAVQKAITIANNEYCDLAILAGDSFDCALATHEPAFEAFLEVITELSEIMPVLILQGTYSHDRPGAMSAVTALGKLTEFPIYVAEGGPQRVVLSCTMTGMVFEPADDGPPPHDARCIINCMPSLNAADPDIMAVGPDAWFRAQVEQWAPANDAANAAGVPTVLVTHGTVQGSKTECGDAIVSPDHVFTVDTLCAAHTQAVMLGHIHKHQAFEPTNDICQGIVYPGSIAHLVHGHTDPVGAVIWDLSFPEDCDEPCWKFHQIPGRRLVNIDFAGIPDMDDLAEIAATCAPEDGVRIRWVVDQEHAHSIDIPAMRKLFAHLTTPVKTEGRINAVQSVRCPGMALAPTTDGRLAAWTETTGDAESLPALRDRLEMLRAYTIAEINATLKVDLKALSTPEHPNKAILELINDLSKIMPATGVKE